MIFFFLGTKLSCTSKLADLLGIAVICAISKEQFGLQILDLSNTGCH